MRGHKKRAKEAPVRYLKGELRSAILASSVKWKSTHIVAESEGGTRLVI